MNSILIVEDNDDNYMLLEEILSDYHLTVVRAESGAAFYSIMADKPNFNLVLMDLMLPDTDGIELTKHLINECIRVPIVFISAYSERCEEVYDLGVKYFLQKPLITELFLSVVGRYVKLQYIQA